MRVTSSFWVDVLIRRCGAGAVPVYVSKRGASEAGAIFVRVEYEDRVSDLFGPAPQALVFDSGSDDRFFEKVLEGADALAVNDYLERQKRFDGDLWVIDIEYRRNRPIDELGISPYRRFDEDMGR